MRNRNLFVILSLTTLLVFAPNIVPVFAANITSVPGVSTGVKKFSFTLNDLNKARQFSPKPQLLLTWEAKVKNANDVLARDAATVKAGVDGVLVRASQKTTECSTQNYTLQDLQGVCKENESVQACLDRLMLICLAIQNYKKWSDAMAVGAVRKDLDKLKQDIANLEAALYPQTVSESTLQMR